MLSYPPGAGEIGSQAGTETTIAAKSVFFGYFEV
jgi:hypothetical protein